VPIGGVADRFSFAIGNALVGNPPSCAALEINLIGPTLQAQCDLACVVTGAPFDLHSDRQPLRIGKTFTLSAGETLSIGGCAQGVRAYLCVKGGIQTPIVLDSRSGLQPLVAEMELPCEPSVIGSRFIELETYQIETTPRRLRVLPGGQSSWFETEGLTGTFQVGPASNRMGLRLIGQALSWPGREMVSEPVCPGTVQVTPQGQCIILGFEGQTIGGYPKIAQVISVDLDVVGQLRSGDVVVFEPATLDEAETLSRERFVELRDWQMRLTL
jgi:antagonist of KipI